MSVNVEYKCRWLDCAHGMSVAGMGSCYAGNCRKSNCKAFETNAEFEAKRKAIADKLPGVKR